MQIFQLTLQDYMQHESKSFQDESKSLQNLANSLIHMLEKGATGKRMPILQQNTSLPFLLSGEGGGRISVTMRLNNKCLDISAFIFLKALLV